MKEKTIANVKTNRETKNLELLITTKKNKPIAWTRLDETPGNQTRLQKREPEDPERPRRTIFKRVETKVQKSTPRKQNGKRNRSGYLTKARRKINTTESSILRTATNSHKGNKPHRDHI